MRKQSVALLPIDPAHQHMAAKMRAVVEDEEISEELTHTLDTMQTQKQHANLCCEKNCESHYGTRRDKEYQDKSGDKSTQDMLHVTQNSEKAPFTAQHNNKLRGGGDIQASFSDCMVWSSLPPSPENCEDTSYNPHSCVTIENGDWEDKNTKIDKMQLSQQMRFDLLTFAQEYRPLTQAIADSKTLPTCITGLAKYVKLHADRQLTDRSAQNRAVIAIYTVLAKDIGQIIKKDRRGIGSGDVIGLGAADRLYRLSWWCLDKETIEITSEGVFLHKVFRKTRYTWQPPLHTSDAVVADAVRFIISTEVLFDAFPNPEARAYVQRRLEERQPIDMDIVEHSEHDWEFEPTDTIWHAPKHKRSDSAYTYSTRDGQNWTTERRHTGQVARYGAQQRSAARIEQHRQGRPWVEQWDTNRQREQQQQRPTYNHGPDEWHGRHANKYPNTWIWSSTASSSSSSARAPTGTSRSNPPWHRNGNHDNSGARWNRHKPNRCIRGMRRQTRHA